jgi:hypothetical protein
MRMAAFPGNSGVHFITRKSAKTDRRRPSTDLWRRALLQMAREWVGTR